MRKFNRREFLKLGGGAVLSIAGCARTAGGKARVVVVGGGFAGATAAKYIRLWDPGIEVLMVEREEIFTSCPMSNLVLGGYKSMPDLQRGYDRLVNYGVQRIRDEVLAVDGAKRLIKLARGGDLSYDRLIVAPGIDFDYSELDGYAEATAAGRVLHAWKAGPQTVALRRQLGEMRDGGIYVLSVPLAPYRCPPAPYERASLVAAYFKQAKPRSKVLILDANPDLTSKGPLFLKAWSDLYPGLVEYRANSRAVGVDAKHGMVTLEVEDVKGDVLNVIPPQRAGDIAARAGLVTTNNRWCDIDWLTMESKAVKHVHVLGDATLAAPAMPKSGSIANNQAKLCAAAVVELINGREPDPQPKLVNACYSFVSPDEAVHLAAVYGWDTGKRTFIQVKGAGGTSSVRSELEAKNAMAWAQNIWADTLG
jgi:sulfide dehydrogenase [flavocytochrome c] flavoprotein subunit